jgi:ribose/xylose/arabinose/galactoside ABC-type transport system permease subunit
VGHRVPETLTDLWFNVGAVPFPFILFVILMVAVWFMLTRTKFARSIYALGGNRMAAMRMGIDSRAVTVKTFAIFGALIGISALFLVSLNASAQPTSSVGFEMTIITAVILGGADINGGRASVFATAMGVLMLGIIHNGMVLIKISMYYQELVNGAIIVIAIISDVLRSMRGEKKVSRVNVITLSKTKEGAA